MSTATTDPTTATTHVFERAGLGRAPFRFVGSERILFQAIPGDPSCPIKPGASCDFCAAAISNVCWIESADGRRSKVGCDCVAKTGDAGLRRKAEEAARRFAAKARHERDGQRMELGAALLARADVRAALAGRPHPQEWQAAKGRTMLDWAEWMWANAGTAGKMRVCKAMGVV